MTLNSVRAPSGKPTGRQEFKQPRDIHTILYNWNYFLYELEDLHKTFTCSNYKLQTQAISRKKERTTTTTKKSKRRHYHNTSDRLSECRRMKWASFNVTKTFRYFRVNLNSINPKSGPSISRVPGVGKFVYFSVCLYTPCQTALKIMHNFSGAVVE